MYLYSASYRVDNDSPRWSLDFYAYDDNDAKARIKAIKKGLRYDGKVEAIIY